MGTAESKPKPGEEEEGQQALFGNPFSFLSEVTCVGVFPVRGHLIAFYRDLSFRAGCIHTGATGGTRICQSQP